MPFLQRAKAPSGFYLPLEPRPRPDRRESDKGASPNLPRLDLSKRFRNIVAYRRESPREDQQTMTMRLFAEPTSMRGDPKIPDDYRPSEDEPFMSDHQRAYFRRKLLAWRVEILRATNDTRLHLHDESVQHPDITDRASTETQLAVELRARDRQRKLIAKIDAALERLDAWHLWLLRRNWRAGLLEAP
jgi:RNA polymerase-binding protein DksA